jgi:hypothetical protein
MGSLSSYLLRCVQDVKLLGVTGTELQLLSGGKDCTMKVNGFLPLCMLADVWSAGLECPERQCVVSVGAANGAALSSLLCGLQWSRI